MIETIQMETIHIELLAQEIVAQLKDTGRGHCARVDFLDSAIAMSVCRYIRHHNMVPGTIFHLLAANEDQPASNPIFITTDKAIEIRNRKYECLCLFIPSEYIGATYSSIANSFALIDGRQLQETVLKHVLKQLSPELFSTVRSVFGQLRRLSGISAEHRLDFALAVYQHMQNGTTEELGLELWRIGLIADASATFLARLITNRDCTVSLSRPRKLAATARERIETLKVDEETATALGQFFRGRAMNDVQAWSRTLAEERMLTFDLWRFPKIEPSDLNTVTIAPFVNAQGKVERYCRLHQPDDAGGSLLARYGAKESIVVRWKTEPELPKDLSRWRVAIVPADSDKGFEESIDERNVPGTRRTVTIKLDMEFEEPPDYAVCVRIAPLSADGSEFIDQDTDKAYVVDSPEFFLVPELITPIEPPRKSLRTVPTLAFGRLEIAVDTNQDSISEEEPAWSSKDLQYFRLHVNQRRMLNIGLSHALWKLEKQILAEPRKGGCFILDVDEVRPVEPQAFTEYPLLFGDSDVWATFWRVREAYFKRFKQEMRDVIEAADWTAELAGAALRYAQAYRDLIEDMVARRADASEIREALSIDTLFIRNSGTGGKAEEAVVVLPTHPLRSAWFASYTQLLHEWEQELLKRPRRGRKLSIDLQALRLLVPTNVPAFVQHSASSTTFTFFQNLLFFHGVALPSGVPDPQRRFGDIALILDTGVEQENIGDIQPAQLTEHLARFQELHPYAETLVTTLINPDRGDFFADAVKKLLLRKTADVDEPVDALPAFQITAYAEDGYKSTFSALEQVRQQQIDLHYGRSSDHFLPGLTTTSRTMSQLQHSSPPEGHIAVVTDFTRPSVVALPLAVDAAASNTSSFSLYGLLNRFVSQFTVDGDGLLWRHRIVTEGIRKPEPHPAGPRYSETLIDLHTSLLEANGYLLSDTVGMRPVLEVRLGADRQRLLERLHTKTNWVITLDRFFTLDYYDSPNVPGLDDMARKYVLDYSPEFTEGLGHRMMVTTAWHEEIESLLSQAMDELGFANIEQSVSRLLHYLKTISGRLALDALESSTGAAAAVGLGVVTAWLQKNKRLRQAVLVPVDMYPQLFSRDGSGKSEKGERRCDLVLISLKRNIVDATFIEVKWRRGSTPLEELAQNMLLQMESSAQIMQNRFFSVERIDGALQRSYLANVLRFYFERSRRYQLFDPEAETSFLEHITRLEKTGLEFRSNYEGYVVSLDREARKPLLLDDAKIVTLTAKDFEDETDSFYAIAQSVSKPEQNSVEPPPTGGQQGENDEVVDEDITVPMDENELVNAVKSDNTIPIVEPVRQDTSEIVIPLGEASGETVAWNPSVKGSPHLFILGIPGQGKSWTVTRILSEFGQQHVPALVLDFHGQFAEAESPFVRKVRPSIIDAARGLPFSPFECTREQGQGGWQGNSLALAEIFAYVVGLGDMQKDVVYTAIQKAYKARGFGEESDDATMLEYPTLNEVLKRIVQEEQVRRVPNVSARCRPLLEMDLFRPTEQTPDLLSLVRSGLVIDLHNLFAETLQLAAGAFVLRKIYKDMFRWGYAKRLRLAIVLDEAHRLAKDITLPKLMKEGRKFGVVVVVASQGLGDFHPDVLNNAGTKVIFRMNYPESRKVSGFIRGRAGQDLPLRIEQLAVGSAYVQTPDMPYGTVVKMNPLEE